LAPVKKAFFPSRQYIFLFSSLFAYGFFARLTALFTGSVSLPMSFPSRFILVSFFSPFFLVAGSADHYYPLHRSFYVVLARVSCLTR